MFFKKSVLLAALFATPLCLQAELKNNTTESQSYSRRDFTEEAKVVVGLGVKIFEQSFKQEWGSVQETLNLVNAYPFDNLHFRIAVLEELCTIDREQIALKLQLPNDIKAVLFVNIEIAAVLLVGCCIECCEQALLEEVSQAVYGTIDNQTIEKIRKNTEDFNSKLDVFFNA